MPGRGGPFATIGSQSSSRPVEVHGPAVSVLRRAPRRCAPAPGRGHAEASPSGRAASGRPGPPREEIVLRRARMTKVAALLLAGGLALSACASDEDGGDNGGSAGGGADGELKIGLAYDAIGRGDKSVQRLGLRRCRGRDRGVRWRVPRGDPERGRLRPCRAARPARRAGLQPGHRRRLRLRRDDRRGGRRLPRHDLRAGRRLERGRGQGRQRHRPALRRRSRARSSPARLRRSRARPARSASSAARTCR